MRRNLLLCSLSLVLALVAPPVVAQGVLVLPKQEGDKPDDKKVDGKQPSPNTPTKPSWTAPSYTPPTKSTGAAPQNKPGTSPIVGAPKPNKEKKPPSKQSEPLPKDVQQAIDDNRDSLNNMLGSITRQPTQVFEQPDYMVSPDKDDRVFEKTLRVTFEKIELSDDEAKTAAAGTSVEPQNLLKSCEPRITGTVVGQGGSGELLDVRGSGGVGRTGYKGSIQNVILGFAVACKLSQPPKDKGIVTKFGDYYVIGVGQGQCVPKGGQATDLTLSYSKRVINCLFR